MDSAPATNPTFQTLQKGVGKVRETKTSNPPKVQLKTGTILIWTQKNIFKIF